MKPSQTFRVIFLFVFWLFLNSCATSHTLVQSQPPDISPRAVKISVIRNISFIEEENYTRIQIEGSETLEPPFYKLLSDPLGIAIDVPNIDLQQIKEPVQIGNGTVTKVLTKQDDHKGRIEIGLTQVTNYNIFREDKNLIIDIEKVKKIVEVGEEVKKEEEAVKEKETELTPPELKKREAPPAQPVEAAAAPKPLKKAKEILSFLFDQKKDSITFNLIADGRPGDYNAFKLDSPPRLVLDIWGVDTRYPKNLIKIQNPFIKKVRIGHYPDKLRFVFECVTPQLPSYQINRVDEKLIISFGNIPQPSEPQIPLKEERDLLIDLEKSQKVEAKIEAIPEARKEEVAVEAKKEEVKEEVKKEEEKPVPELKKPEIASPQVEEGPAPQTPVTKEPGAEVGKEAKKEEEALKEQETELTPRELKKEEAPPVQPVETPAAPEPLKKAKEILSFLFDQKKDSITFNLVADGRLGDYNAFKLDSPPRLVLDLWEMDTRYPKNLIEIQNPFIKKVRIGHYPDKLRLVFECVTPQLPSYQINRVDDKLIISFGNIPQPLEAQIRLKEGKPTERISPLKAQVKAPIEFKQMDNKSRIVVSLTEEPQFESHTVSKKVVAVDIKNAFLPKHLQKGLDTSEFDSAVKYIDVKNVRAGKANNVRILVRLREEVPFETTKEGKTLFIDIEKPKKVEAKIEATPEARKEEVAVETKKEEVKKEEEKPIPESKKPEIISPQVEEKPVPQPQVTKKVEEQKKDVEKISPEKTYSEKKLSLDFKDADIKNILRLIAEVSNLNIIAGDDVTGKITMRLMDVPWDQALDIILQAKALGITRIGNVIRIAPIDKLRKEVDEELNAKFGREQKEELIADLIPVNYAVAKDLMLQIRTVLSPRGDIKIDERTNTFIVKDIPKNVERVKDLIKRLDSKTPQVLIEARIVEANLTFQNELGVAWGFLASTGTDKNKTGTVGGGIPGTSTVSPGTITNNVVNLPTVSGGGVLEFLFSSKYGLKQLDLAISAHESRGDVKIISSPKIATLNNKEASIEQGLRIPYRKLTTEGTITTDFIDANLKLTVTPHVTNDGNIKMIVKAKKDAPDTSITVDGVPSIDKKEAITEVMVKDNGVVVIAGVYSIEKDFSAEGVPLFNKIPVLGWLFKRNTKQDKRKDLLIFISPKIIKDEI